MSKFKSEKVMPRYFAIAVVLTLIGFAIVGKAMVLPLWVKPCTS